MNAGITSKVDEDDDDDEEGDDDKDEWGDEDENDEDDDDFSLTNIFSLSKSQRRLYTFAKSFS